MFGSAESEIFRLISREIIFAEFQRMFMIAIHQHYRQTDGQTDRQLALAMAIPRYA